SRNTRSAPGPCRVADHRLTDVRFGSKADIREGATDVRFTPESGHWNSVVECPLCATSGHCAISIAYKQPREKIERQCWPKKLNQSESAPTKMRLRAQMASRLNQLRDTSLRPR